MTQPRRQANRRTRRRIARVPAMLMLLAALALVGKAASAGDQAALAPPAKVVGQLGDTRLREVSGLAASHRRADRYWLHNDSGDGAFLYAIDAHGALQGMVQIDGVLAVDWEDIASFERNGKAYLMVADCGDNLGMRSQYTLIAIEEPELPADGSIAHVTAAWQQHYRYPDGPHDTEAMAVDAASGNVLLLPKFVEPLQVYRVALAPDNDVLQVAQSWVSLAEPASDIKGGTAIASTGPKFRPTALSLASDGRHAAVLGYRSARLYERRRNEDWAAALTRAPRRIGVVPPLRQPEALGFTRDGSALLITGEGQQQPVLRVDLKN